jgi:hypothetical protein
LETSPRQQLSYFRFGSFEHPVNFGDSLFSTDQVIHEPLKLFDRTTDGSWTKLGM